MSLLDVIKNFFCKNSCDKPETKPETKPENEATAVVEEETTAVEEVVSEPVIEAKPEVAEVATPTPVTATAAVKVAKLQIPEDSTLKRHFLSALKAEIEAGMPPRPSESTLKRHYDAAVQAELEKMLG